MSTKTTIKRIALVAVAALGFGTLSVAPSFAGTGLASGTVTLASATSAATVGVETTVGVTFTGYCLGASAAGPQDNRGAFAIYTDKVPATGTGAITGLALTKSTTAPTGATSTQDNATAIAIDCTAAGFFTAAATAKVTLPSAGTYVFKIDGVYQVAGSASWTVTATAADVAASAAKSTSFLNAGETTTATADATVTASMALSDTATATIVVTPKNAADAAIPATALTVAVSGPGTVAAGANLAAISALSTGTGRSITGAAGSYVIGVFADGTPGVSTVTISSGTTVLATETVTFYGAAAKITPTVVNSVLAIGANTGAITAVVTDAAGVVVPGVTVYAVSATAAAVSNSYTSCGASSATGAVSCDLAGVAAGTSAITLTLNSASTGTSTVSVVAGTMRVSDGVVTKVDYAFDKESYAPGETAKITATVSNAAGVMPAGTYTVLSSAGVTANYTVAGLPAATVLAVASTGKASYTVTIPTGITGDLQLIGTAAATTIAATFGKAAVVNVALDAAIAATDAASEAIDAANAATDAANAAAEAADAATAAAQDSADAVAALAVQVTEQMAELKALNDAQAKAIAALRKQLIALTNLIIKIQKKVKA